MSGKWEDFIKAQYNVGGESCSGVMGCLPRAHIAGAPAQSWGGQKRICGGDGHVGAGLTEGTAWAVGNCLSDSSQVGRGVGGRCSW